MINYKKPFILAVLLHAILFVFLFVKFAMHHTYAVAPGPKVHIVQAVAVNQAQVEKEIRQIKEEKTRHEQQELARIKRLQKEALAAKKARLAEQAKLKKIKQAQVDEQNRLKKAKEQQAVKAKRQDEIQKSIERQLVAEQNQGEIDKYKALIIAAISQHWIIPDNVAPNISCQLLVHVATGGIVTSVDLARSSGNQILDRSARTAVLKASPLPVPGNPALFNNFRLLKLTARPEGIS